MADEPGTLFIVATPLGNLEDMSPRAVKTLATVDLIACEDTRHSRKVLQHFGVERPTTSYHEHNEREKTPYLISNLQKGLSIALISDAGTPLLSDPGYGLVRECHNQGIRVIPVPGPFAGAAAVSVSGLPTDRILFAGFLPKRKGALEKQLESLKRLEATLVFYLSPHRLSTTLEMVARVLGDRQAFLIREMTKVFESSNRGSLRALCKQVVAEEARGEYTLVVEGAKLASETPLHLDEEAYVEGLVQLRNVSLKDAVRKAASDLGTPRRRLYNLVMARKTD